MPAPFLGVADQARPISAPDNKPLVFWVAAQTPAPATLGRGDSAAVLLRLR